MVVALLYEIQAQCNCFTLSLSGSDGRRSNGWRHDHDAIFYCMRWSWFVTKLSATRRSHMVVALLYEMQSPSNCVTLSLSGSDSRSSNSWRDDNDASMEIKVSSRWRWWSWRCFGDGDQRHKMMMAISYHLYWLHVMFILYASYFA